MKKSTNYHACQECGELTLDPKAPCSNCGCKEYVTPSMLALFTALINRTLEGIKKEENA